MNGPSFQNHTGLRCFFKLEDLVWRDRIGGWVIDMYSDMFSLQRPFPFSPALLVL